MTCNINRPEPSAIFNKYKNLFETTVLGGAAVVEESNEWYAVSLNYAMAEEFHAISNQAWKETDPSTACCENLYKIAERDGVYPYPAQPAQGYIELTGTTGAAIPSSLQVSIDGNYFLIASSATNPGSIGADGKAYVRVRAVVPGVLAQPTDNTGQVTPAVAGINDSVNVLYCQFCWGKDAESCEAFRQRYINRMSYRFVTNNEWAISKLLEWPCVTRVVREPNCDCEEITDAENNIVKCGCQNCSSRNNYYVFMDDSFEHGIIPDTIRAEIEAWFFGEPQGYGLGEAPIGVCGNLLTPIPVPVNVSVSLAGCVSSGASDEIKEIVKEFFTTVEPGAPLDQTDLQTTLNIAFGEYGPNVSIELVDPSVGYGGDLGPPSVDKYVYVTGCGIEPDRGYLPTLNDLWISIDSPTVGGCA